MPVTSWAELRKARLSRFGVNGDVAVTNAAGGSVVLAANPQRIAWTVVNNEANAAHLVSGNGVTPTSSSGARLDAAGGMAQMSLEVDGTVVQDAVRVILDTAAGVVWVQEVLEG